MEKQKDPTKVSMGKVLAWNSRPVALGAITIVIGYFSIYCTDTLGMNAALVGMLLMASKIIDGVTDLLAGYMVDNTRTKWGKARPYEICIVLAWLCTVLLFSARSSWALPVKAIWIFVMYTLVFSIFSTFLNAAEAPYCVRAFGSKEAITKVSALGGIFVTVGCMAVSISFPMLMGKLATSDKGWSQLMLIYAIPLVLIGILRFIFIKEEFSPNEEVSEKTSLKEMLSMLRNNKYAWCMAGINGATQFVAGLGAATYYFTWVVGDIGKYSVLQVFSIVSLLVMLVFPAIIKRKSANFLIMMGAVLGIIGYGINLFAGANMIVLIVAFLFTGIAVLPASYLRSVMVMEISKYNQWKGYTPLEATTSALANFFGKIFTAFGSLVLGTMLSLGGYDGSLASQSTGAMNMIKILYSIVPMIAMVVMLFSTIIYKSLVDKMPEIEADLEAKEAK